MPTSTTVNAPTGLSMSVSFSINASKPTVTGVSSLMKNASSIATGPSLLPVMVISTSCEATPPCPSSTATVYTSVTVSPSASACAAALSRV